MPKLSKRKRITLSKIAEICGVSRQVVSMVAAGKKHHSIRYSDETRDRILKVIKDTGYRPNRTVSGFFNHEHGALGLLVRSVYHIQPGVLKGLIVAAKARNQMITIEYLDGNGMPKMVVEDCVDGIILYETVDPEIIKSIHL